MPIYEFECLSCNAVFEKLVLSSQQNSMEKCPVCNSTKVRKLISGFAFSNQSGSSGSKSQPSSMPPGGCSSGFSGFR